MEQPVVGPQGPSQDGMYGSRRSRLQKVDSKLSAHMDSEDRRVKELTEGILYDFLPAALNVMLPRCEDPLQELDADRCRAVASAALAVSALMNAPPGFLEFLLCVPWRKLSQLYPKSDSIDKLVSNLQVTDEERRRLVNTRIDPALMGTLLDFLYKEKHTDSVPPMLQLTPVNPLQPDDKSAPQVVRETVAAVLDGATPLHCAAMRGNPAQVDHLLFCGADPTLTTAAGELPIELVPVCGDRAGTAPGQRNCRCMGPHDQEVWECRSRLARSLIARRCFFSFGVGLFSWLRLVVFCLLCLLGQAGRHTSISRPVVERHIDTRRQQKVAVARARAHALVTRMRSEAEAGHRHLAQAKRDCRESAAFEKGPPDISTMCFTDPTKLPPPPPPQFSQIHDINLHLQESGTSSTGEELPSEKAFKCFVRSVHALQSLDLHGETVPQVFAELVAAGGAESRETHVLEDEQADLYSCWAESVLLKFRGCTCPGCAALAIQAVRMAHIQATRLFGKVDRVKATHAERWRSVGQALARVVYVHICLLLETEAQGSPTRSLVWRAEQCLREWDRLEKAGLTQGAGVLDPRHVAALQLWAKTADSDLYLAEALHGQSLPPTKTLQEVVLGAVTYTTDGAPILARPVSAEVVASLDQAITLASLPSPLLAHIVRGVVANAAAELAAAARLRELVGAKGTAPLGGGGTSDAVMALTEALRAAEPFRSRLGPELEAALELRSKWTHRAMAVEKLEGAVEEVRVYTTTFPLSFSLAGATAAGAAATSGTLSTSSPGRKAAPAATAAADGKGPTTEGGGSGEPAGSPAGGQSDAADAAAAASAAGTVADGSGSTGDGGGIDGGASGPERGPSGGDAQAATATHLQAPQQPLDLAEWERRMKQLELAMNDAKDANVSVTKAKRLHKEMVAIAAAAEASRQLEAVMARRPSGPQQLKMALNRAEAAASALSGLGGPPMPGLAEVLGPLMAAARRRLDTERAAEALSKAAASYRTLGDLGRLEAAIYNAKKIGAEELDPESYRISLELRAHLQDAARGRRALETALRNLQNQLRPEDAQALERALQDASPWEDLLAADTAKARKALEQWRIMAVCEAKLARLLREGASTSVLAKAIQEAAASGVKVQQAKRVLKLMQALEAVLTASAADVAGAAERHAQVKAKLEAAEQGGVTAGPLPEAARRALARLAALAVREALEAALKPHSDWSTAQRIAVLREALYKAEGVLGTAPSGSVSKSGCGSEEQANGGQPVQAAGAAAGSGKGEGPRHQNHVMGQQSSQQQQPKLANGSAVGKTSRGKRSSGGSPTGATDAAAPAAVTQDDASSTPSLSCSCSNAGGSNSSSSSNSGHAVTVEDDEVLQTVRELARKARQVLEEDQAEVARIERERQEAERARKEAQERERQERLRLEQERQRRERAEAAERERALAERREKAKAEKSRQHQHQYHHKGKATASLAITTVPESSAAPPPAGPSAGAGAAVWEKPPGGGSKGGGGSSRQGGSKSSSTQAAAAAPAPPPGQPSATLASSSQGASCGRSHGATAPGSGRPSTSFVAAPPPPPCAASSFPFAAAAQQPQQSASTTAGASVPASIAGSQQPDSASRPPDKVAPGLGPIVTPASSSVPSGGYLRNIGRGMHGPEALAGPSPMAHTDGSPVVDVQALLRPPPSASVAVTAAGPLLITVGDGRATPVVVHSRGDSLESLGEVVHKLNRDVIEALDMDDDAVLAQHETPSSLGASVAVGSAGTLAAVGSMMGAAAAAGGTGIVAGGGAASFATYSGGGSFGRTGSGAAATADSANDQTASQRTSSFMSSVASADDVMLQGAASTNIGGAGGVLSGGGALGGGALGGGALGGGACLSTISSGQPSAGGAGGAATAADVLSSPLSASACAADGSMLVQPGASGVGGSGVAGGAGKPRFGFVDLGGASWGLDSPLLTGAGGALPMFSSLQSSVSDYGSMLGAAKPDAAGGGGSGWSTGPLGAGAAAPGAMLFGTGGQHPTVVAGGPGGSSVGGADERHHLGGGAVPGAGSVAATSALSGGLGVGPGGGACLGHMHVHSPDPGIGVLAAGVVSSPRTTVATASAGMHGLLHVRPLGAGGAPAPASGLTQLAGLMLPSSVPGGRPSLHMHQLHAGQQGGSGGGGVVGVVARSGFWTPPSFQQAAVAAVAAAATAGGELASADAGGGLGPGGGAAGLGMGMHHLGMGHSGGAAATALQLVDWQVTKQQSGDTNGGGLQVLCGGSGGATPGPQQLIRTSISNPPGSASRVCRFYLQGFCRDGERCRFAHVTPLTSPSGGSGTPTSGSAAAAAAAASVQLHVHGAHGHVLVSPSGGGGVGGGTFGGGVAGHGSNGGAGLNVLPSNVAQSKTVGSFAFGAPGAEAFAPLGSSSMSRVSGGHLAEQGGTELLLSRASAPQLRAGSAAAGSGGGGSVTSSLERSQLSSYSAPAMASGLSDTAASSGGGGGSVMLGHLQQAVQLRDSATGATFAAVLTPVVGGSPGGPQPLQQPLLLSLPDDLTFSPPSLATTPGSTGGSVMVQSRK